MFTGTDLKLALVMGSVIIIGFICMRIIVLNQYKGFKGHLIKIKIKPLNKYMVFGGMIFGSGWAISGACQGTVLSQLVEGKLLRLFTIIGAVLETYLYARIVEKHPEIS